MSRPRHPFPPLDDGITIQSRVKFPPINPGGLSTNTRVRKTLARLSTDSDPTTLKVYAAESPQAVVSATLPAWSHLVAPEYPYSVPRVTGNSLLFELSNSSFTSSWASGLNYVVGSQVVASDGLPYVSLTIHTSTDSGTDLHPTPPGNTTDWVVSAFRTWALEDIMVFMDSAGTTRHGRL